MLRDGIVLFLHNHVSFSLRELTAMFWDGIGRYYLLTHFSNTTPLIRKLRASGTNQLLINLSGALLGLYISFICAAKGSFNAPFCSFLAVLVHYFFLAYFFWTASEAVYLYLKLVKVLVSNSITDNYSLISIFVCWSKSEYLSLFAFKCPAFKFIFFLSQYLQCLLL